ncbi:AI-2E family transporter [Vallitalea okinawensis]|uniref:AI-2E family transporter n=1 Tax=Vallitalea okinawensis TaxID=2078660 RepID=UPI000CFB0F26|nr:AI-2E family transporter [Vallitalea okinawensis]
MFKIDWDKDKITYILLRVILITYAILVFKFSMNWDDTLTGVGKYIDLLFPFLLGFLFAFLINPGVTKFEAYYSKLYFRKGTDKNKKKEDRAIIEKKKKRVRNLSIFTMYLIVLFFVVLTIRYIVPQLLDSISTLLVDFPDVIEDVVERATVFSDNIVKDSESFNQFYDAIKGYIPSVLGTIESFFTSFIPSLLETSISITNNVFDLVMALIISVYLIADKERFIILGKKLNYAIFKKGLADHILEISRECNNIFKRFFVGKTLDSLIIGILCFICMNLFNFPYALLISVIVGITNMIPYFGPFIGAVPGFFIILFVDPIKSLWFILFILALQQFDGIILGPKILGESVGLRPIWIVFSIIVGGGLFGFAGMLLGVPTFTVLYNLTKRYINKRLENKLITKEDLNNL